LELMEQVELASKKGLCPHCLGRLFGRMEHGFTNYERGISLLKALENGKFKGFDHHQEVPVKDPCPLCKNVFSELERFSLMLDDCASKFEFTSFHIGSRFDPAIIEKEESIWSELGLKDYEPIKVEFNRELGKHFEETRGKVVDLELPDIIFLVDTFYDHVELEVRPLYIYGRYRKLERGIPQTKWPCRECLGKGCERCNNTGKMYQESVEELVAVEFLKAADGKGEKFHGMGREDIDALMLGNGRPFILEITRPKKRKLDLPALEKATNRNNKGRVEIEELRPSDKREVVDIKNAKSDKSYRVSFEMDADPKEKLIKVTEVLVGSTIHQRTPARVSHRRAEKVRKRRIKAMEILKYENRTVTLEVTAESGTYIKELIHGDEGRTDPSISSILGVGCKVLSLDVLEIHDN